MNLFDGERMPLDKSALGCIRVIDLMALLAIIDHGGFRAAARAMNTSQTAVSRQVCKLETALGQVIFIRDARDIRLTPYGRTVVALAREVVSLCSAWIDCAEPIQAHSVGPAPVCEPAVLLAVSIGHAQAHIESLV
ncbi:MAG: helix-turn-helix domain-containing protein [Burkholderiaceae bacterium]